VNSYGDCTLGTMKISELCNEVKIKVGQYWLVPGSDVPTQVEKIENSLVYFNNTCISGIALGSGFTFLWYSCVLSVTNFTHCTEDPSNYTVPEPGEIWVNDASQDIFFIHPDQTGVEENLFRVLSDSSRIKGPASLFKNVE
jgi:hypothetical protein